MKKIFSIVAMVSLLVIYSFASPTAKVALLPDDNTPLDHERYTGYIVNPRVPAGASFYMFTEREEFDELFKGISGSGITYLPKDVFESRFVVAVVNNGKYMTTYTVTNIARQKDKLRIAYEMTKKPTPTSTQRTPLILAIDKTDFDYSEIIFTENGKDVYRVNLKD